ncbi:MAG: MarR family transcriptional regulator [Acidobacteriota bacterium]
MAGRTPDELEEILNGFAEVMARLMIDQHQQHVAALDLTLPQAQMLRILRRGRLPTGRLAAKLKVTASSVTQLSDRLMRKGLIERQAAENDRRSVIVSLSSKGKRLVDGFRKRRAILFREALTRLNRSEQADVIEAMKMIVNALNSQAREDKQG